MEHLVDCFFWDPVVKFDSEDVAVFPSASADETIK